MSLSEKVPLMREGSTGWNGAVGIGYIVTLPFWLWFLPFIVFALVWRDYGGIASSLSSVPGISAGGGVFSGVVAFVFTLILSGVIIVICLVLFGIIVAISGGGDPGTTGMDTATVDGGEPTASPVSNDDETATDGGTETPTPTESTPTPTPTESTPTPTPTESTPTPTPTESTPTPTTTPAPAPDGESYTLSGSGNDVTDSFDTEGGLVVFDFEHDGSSNFQVQAVNNAGDREYLVNEIGTYDGEVALYLPRDTWRLDVTADGAWSTDVTQPRFNEQDIESLPTEVEGEHAAWFGPFEFEESTTVTFEIKDNSHAAVWLTNHNGQKVTLVHNEIGPYEGTALVTDRGIGLIIVDTDSAEWRIRIGG